MQPISKKQEARFRGPTSSADFNKWVEDNYFDLVQLFSASNQNREDIDKNLDMLQKENHFLEAKIKSLEDRMASVLLTAENIATGASYPEKVMTKSFHSLDNIEPLDPTEEYAECQIDTNFGVAHIPVEEHISKIYLMGDKPHLPKSFKATVYESLGPIDKTANIIPLDPIEDESILNAFNGDPNSFWQRSITKNAGSVSEVYALIDIELPQNIINHTRVSSIYLNPSPEHSFSILDILYLGEGSAWTSLPTYPRLSDGSPEEIRSTVKIPFFFEPQNTLRLRIYLKQDNPISSGNLDTFVYGFNSIDVFFTRFSADTAKMKIAFALPDSSDKVFNTITKIEPIFVKGGEENSQLVETHFYLESDSTERDIFHPTPIPVPTKKVIVEIIMKQKSGASPALSKVNLHYTTS